MSKSNLRQKLTTALTELSGAERLAIWCCLAEVDADSLSDDITQADIMRMVNSAIRCDNLSLVKFLAPKLIPINVHLCCIAASRARIYRYLQSASGIRDSDVMQHAIYCHNFDDMQCLLTLHYDSADYLQTTLSMLNTYAFATKWDAGLNFASKLATALNC